MTGKEAIEILETMTAEPEDGQEARLSADELDAVLYAVKVLKGEEIPDGTWEYDPPHDYARRFGKWQFLKGGCYKCNRCQCYSLHQTNYCAYCGALMATNSTIDIGGKDNEN